MPDTSGITSGAQNPYATPNYAGAAKNGSTDKTEGASKGSETEKPGASSGSSNPYATQYYSHASTDKNTLTITDYFKLLSAQLANQDMNNPMSNSEMMAQMVQMAMVQSMTFMNEMMENVISTIQNSQIISTQTYAAGLVGQEVTVSVTEKDNQGGWFEDRHRGIRELYQCNPYVPFGGRRYGLSDHLSAGHGKNRGEDSHRA